MKNLYETYNFNEKNHIFEDTKNNRNTTVKY